MSKSRKQQSKRLLTLDKISDIPVDTSTLSSCKRIISDRDRDIVDLSEDEIFSEMKSQGVTGVKRFTPEKFGNILKPNTYLFTFMYLPISTLARIGLLWIYMYIRAIVKTNWSVSGAVVWVTMVLTAK